MGPCVVCGEASVINAVTEISTARDGGAEHRPGGAGHASEGETSRDSLVGGGCIGRRRIPQDVEVASDRTGCCIHHESTRGEDHGTGGCGLSSTWMGPCVVCSEDGGVDVRGGDGGTRCGAKSRERADELIGAGGVRVLSELPCGACED